MSGQQQTQYKITPGALVCNEAEISGEVTIGVRTVVHPKARIIAENGKKYLLNEICVNDIIYNKCVIFARTEFFKHFYI